MVLQLLETGVKSFKITFNAMGETRCNLEQKTIKKYSKRKVWIFSVKFYMLQDHCVQFGLFYF